jgi:hypothetical protein
MQGCFIATFPYIHSVYLHYIHPHPPSLVLIFLHPTSKDFIVQFSYKNTKYIDNIYLRSLWLFTISLSRVLTSQQDMFYIPVLHFFKYIQRGFSIVFYTLFRLIPFVTLPYPLLPNSYYSEDFSVFHNEGPFLRVEIWPFSNMITIRKKDEICLHFSILLVSIFHRVFSTRTAITLDQSLGKRTKNFTSLKFWRITV